MKQVKEITDKYQSLYAAGKALGVNSTQLKRWLDTGAMVDATGSVWIKTKGNINAK